MLIYRKDMIIVKDEHNSTEHVNVFNIKQNEKKTMMKIITIYGQPNKKKTIMNNLIRILNRFLRTEAGINTIIMGDFNLDFNNKAKQEKEFKAELEGLGY
jgi:hypothetical protein